ncbi:MAG TPA: DUF2182 domain-containing protein [Thermoanaerobaculia bacterium]|jgi:predicted metal-binding membrane protein
MTAAARERLRVRIPLLAVSGAAWLALALAPHALHRATLAHPGALALASELMFASMMLPAAGAPLRHVRERSFARRRSRAVLLFIAGYGGVWTAFGMLLIVLAARLLAAGNAAAVAACLVAAAWQCSPAKQRCLNRGHEHPPLRAFAPAADRDALRFGLVHSVWCAGSCWNLMLVPLLLSHGHLPAMAAATLWLLSERLERPLRAAWHWRGPAKGMRLVTAQARLLFAAARSPRAL